MTSFRTVSVLVLGAAVLAVLTVLFWPARQEEKPPAVPSPVVALAPHGASSERESSPPVSDQGVQSGIVAAEVVEAGVAPVSTASTAPSAASWSEADMPRSLAELYALDRADRTPRPFLVDCLTFPPTAFICPRGGPLLTEEVDPDWSHAMEKRLRAIWDENVTGISDEFLFVMCKTTLCQINYRFQAVTDITAPNNPFNLFLQGVRTSDLMSELRRICVSYSGSIMAVEYERKSPPGRTPADANRSGCVRGASDMKQRGP